MYALPEMAAANAALWAALRAALAAEGMVALPDALTPPPGALPEAIAPDTLFSQMCGYPLRRFYNGQYRLLGVPLYDLPGCGWFQPGVPGHRSFVIVAGGAPWLTLEALRGRRFAMNGRDSNSGMNLPRRLLAPLAGGRTFFSEVIATGGHLGSMDAVAAGAADAAAIDCVTYGFCAIHRPTLVARLRILAETAMSPAIPFITAAGTGAAEAAALSGALAVPGPAVAAALSGLRIAAVLPPQPAAYEALLAFEAEAAALGYPTLA